MGVLTGVLFLIIGGAMMLYAVYLAGRRHHGADSDAALREAQSIVEDARSKGALIVREAELKAKDLLVEVRESGFERLAMIRMSGGCKVVYDASAR